MESSDNTIQSSHNPHHSSVCPKLSASLQVPSALLWSHPPGSFPAPCVCRSLLAKQGGGWTYWRGAPAAQMWPQKLPLLPSCHVKTSCQLLQTCPSSTPITQDPKAMSGARDVPPHMKSHGAQCRSLRGSNPSVHPQRAPKAPCFLGKSTSWFIVCAESHSHIGVCIPQSAVL